MNRKISYTIIFNPKEITILLCRWILISNDYGSSLELQATKIQRDTTRLLVDEKQKEIDKLKEKVDSLTSEITDTEALSQLKKEKTELEEIGEHMNNILFHKIPVLKIMELLVVLLQK